MFGTAINCIDGRVQQPVIDFIKSRFKVDFVDMVTEPGPDKLLSENSAPADVESVKERVELSVTKHMSRIVVIAGHHDCAANQVGEEEHKRQIARAVENVRAWGLEAEVRGLWVDENWKAGLL